MLNVILTTITIVNKPQTTRLHKNTFSLKGLDLVPSGAGAVPVDELDLTALGSRMSVEQISGLRAKVDTGVENDKAPVARSGPSSL